MTELPNPFLNSAPTGPIDEVARDVWAYLDAFPVSDGARLGSLPSGESEPSVTLACAPSESRFVLDEAAFMDAIEPAPLFLSDPRPEYLDAIPDAVLAVLAGY